MRETQHTLSVKKQKKKTVKSDQYLSPTNNFIPLNLTPTKNFYQFFFLNKKPNNGNLKRSVTLTVVVMRKTSTLTLILMKQFT